MNRRVSLPGVDELFGARPSGPDRGPASGADRADTTAAEPGTALTVLRQAVAGEDAAVQAARAAAQDLRPPSPEVGALLRWLAVDHDTRTVVEVGAAGGVSGLWLLAGMSAGGVLTSLELDPHAHRLAASALEGADTEARVRSIQGEGATLLDRLADASYDLVLLQNDHAAYPEHLTRARTLLRPGGLLVARGVLPVGDHEEPLGRFLHDLLEDPGFSATVLPLDDGVAIATRTPERT